MENMEYDASSNRFFIVTSLTWSKKVMIAKEKETIQRRKYKIPVSFLQEIHIEGIKSNLYNPEEIRIPGPSLGYTIKEYVNVPALDRATTEIVRRHEILRTSYRVTDGRSYQIINETPEKTLNIVNLKDFKKKDEKKKEICRILSEISSYKFDVFNDLLMIKFTLISFENEHKLLITSHHIATDAISLMILHRELFLLYHAFANNLLSPLPELPVQYADFSIWESTHFSDEYINEKLTYWKEVLSNSFELRLPTDHRPQSKISLKGASVPVSIKPDLVNKLMILSNENRVTFFTILLAGYFSAVYCFSGYRFNESVIPVTRRTQREIKSLIGCFNDFQCVRIDFSNDPDFEEIIKRTYRTVLDARDNYVPSWSYLKQFSSLPKYSKTQIGFNFIQSPYRSTTGTNSYQGEKTVIPFKIPLPKTSLFAFSMDLIEDSGSVTGDMTYQKNIFERKTMINLVNDYINLLEDIVSNPKTRISEMNIKPHEGVKIG
ncbi:condensation domain-containing protein [Thermodesulfobacteriota bacterium]